MSTPAPRSDEKVITGLLLAVLILAAIALLREGPNYDNVLESWRFFTTVFFTGMLLGFLGWTQAFHTVPTLSFAAPHRQPWIGDPPQTIKLPTPGPPGGTSISNSWNRSIGGMS